MLLIQFVKMPPPSRAALEELSFIDMRYGIYNIINNNKPFINSPESLKSLKSQNNQNDTVKYIDASRSTGDLSSQTIFYNGTPYGSSFR